MQLHVIFHANTLMTDTPPMKIRTGEIEKRENFHSLLTIKRKRYGQVVAPD